MISGKVNNVTVVTEVILHAPGMTNVVKVAVGVGTLSQETELLPNKTCRLVFLYMNIQC